MKKLLLSLAMCAFISVSYAQKAKKFNAKSAAKDFCTCTTEFADGLHPLLISMMHDIVLKGEAVAEKNLQDGLMALSEDERNKVTSAIDNELDTKSQKFTECVNAWKAKYGELDDKKRKDIIAKLDKMKGCELADEFAHMWTTKKEKK